MTRPGVAPGRGPAPDGGPTPGRDPTSEPDQRPPKPPAAGPVRLLVEDHPAAADIALLDEQVATYTSRATRLADPVPLAVLARDGGALVGGVHGWTWGGCCELAALWVSPPRRGRGLGRALLAAAEDVARARRCRQVVLLTHDVQAPDLYRRAGYDVVGQVADYPAGGTAYWFRKRLDRPTAPPGAQKGVGMG